MFLEPATKAKSAMNETSQTMNQFVQDRNITELAIIELIQDIDRLDGDVAKARQRLKQLEAQVVAKWTAIA